MKVDAHCAFAPGFDTAMLEAIQPDWTMAPLMKNLHAFDWVCKCGERTYQGPKRCGRCGSTDLEMDVVWRAKPSPNSTAYRFDNTMHFQYWGEFKKRPGGRGPLSESMSLQGSCWMATRDKYFELGLCDEEFGSWGQQGVEVACKTWLFGGKVMVNHNTWYAHMFRTNGPEFGFPYPISGKQVDHARQRSREIFQRDHIFNELRAQDKEHLLDEESVRRGISAGTYKSPHLKLLNLSKETRTAFELSGFDMFIETFDDEKAAIASF